MENLVIRWNLGFVVLHWTLQELKENISVVPRKIRRLVRVSDKYIAERLVSKYDKTNARWSCFCCKTILVSIRLF